MEARALGRGGIARVAEATGLSRATIGAGLRELSEGSEDDDAGGRLRGPGAGRKALSVHDAGLVAALERLVDPATRGDPTGPLRWTCSSAARLARALQEAGHRVSERSVNRLLHELGYSLQANRKTLEGKQHPDRDAQFKHINRRVRAFQRQRQPVVSVDTKKKELVGPFENAGREWRPRKQPEPVRVHDFPDKVLGKAIPYGVYDLTRDAGWVSVGIDHDTASFAVETLRRWWRRMGCVSYPAARRLLITADGGGSNGSRNRLWKRELQQLADETGLPDFGVPLSAWDEQVEQDGAPDVLPHYGELSLISRSQKPPRGSCSASTKKSRTRLRQRVTKGAGSRTKGLLMAYQLVAMAQRRWRRLNGAHLLPLVRAGVVFVDGVIQTGWQTETDRKEAA